MPAEARPTLFGPDDSTVPTAAYVCLKCRTVNARDVKGTR